MWKKFIFYNLNCPDSELIWKSNNPSISRSCWFTGLLITKYRVNYGDGDTELLNLEEENWQCIDDEKQTSAFFSFNISNLYNDEWTLFNCNLAKPQLTATAEMLPKNRMEINGLQGKKVFKEVPKEKVVGYRVYGSRFVDDSKNQGFKT